MATVHREANVFQPRLGNIMEGLNRLQERVVFPAHPRTRAQLESEGIDARLPHPSHRSAELPRARLARLAGPRHRHRLRRPPEGGVLVRGPLRDASALHGMDGDGRGGRERPRGRRSRRDRGGGDRGGRCRRRDLRCTATATPPHGSSACWSLRCPADEAGRRHRGRRVRRRAARTRIRRGRQERRSRRHRLRAGRRA